MTTWPEARAKKTERQRREGRVRLGPNRCKECGERIARALVDQEYHPTCGPVAAAEMRRDG